MWFSTLLLKNVLRRKFRSALTCIGFAVAVGTTVALLGVSESFERAWLESMTRRGFDIVVVEGGKPNQTDSELEESVFKEKIEQVPGVKSAAPNMVRGTSLEYVDTPILLQGWEPGSTLIEEMEILKGRFFTAGEGRVVVLGTQLADSIEKTVGDSLEVEGAEFEVIGVFRSFNVYENGSIILPLEEMQNLMASPGKVTGFALVLEDDVKQDKDKIQAIVDQLNAIEHREPSGYKVELQAMSSEDYVSNTLYIKLANAMAWMTSVIAVIVGSIGVLNTMIMSVVERVREISILRAIGWKKSRVVRMILGEALILSLVGAALGIVTAILLVQWLTTLPAVAGFIEGTIAPSVLGKGVILSLVVGLLGGAYPAWHAARLLPSEGLRHE